MKSKLAIALAVSALAFAADDQAKAVKHIDEAASVFTEINQAPDKGIPHDILEKAQCIGIVPNLKRAGFVVGAKYGKGVVVCRAGGHWSAPSTIRVEGGSVGFQIGAGETDLVFTVMNQRGMDKLMADKFTIGGDASAMGGPVGRSAEAQTDAMMHAEILSWSRARGLFAGISLEGSTLRPDKDENTALYGANVTQQEILTGKVKPPAAAHSLYTVLNRYSGTKSAHR
jgi:lipid-binding SYLF domain-containing protein